MSKMFGVGGPWTPAYTNVLRPFKQGSQLIMKDDERAHVTHSVRPVHDEVPSEHDAHL
jgi:hypothetical protein